MLPLIILILITIHKGDIRIENSTENIFILFLASIWYIFLCQRSMSSAKKNSKIFTRWLELKVSMVISKALEHVTSQNIVFFESAKLYTRATNFYYYYHLLFTRSMSVIYQSKSKCLLSPRVKNLGLMVL